MNKTYFLVLLAIALPILVIIIKFSIEQPRYRIREILTENELEFFHRLRRALPGHFIFPQVAMSALIEAKAWGKKSRESDRNRISQKRVDFAVYSEEMRLLAVVELDDKTHKANKDKQRDSYLASAGIKTIRYQAKSKPTEEQIASAFMQLPVPETNG